MGSVGNCSGVLKRSAETGKINVLTTDRRTTHRHNDELRNMFFRNNPGKIVSLKNYYKSQVSKLSQPDMTSQMMMISRSCPRITILK